MANYCRAVTKSLRGTTTFYRKSELCNPRNEAVRPCSQVLHSCFWERFIYIPRIGLLFRCSKIGRLILGIYESLTDTWMWKLEDRQYNSVLEITRPVVSFLGIHKSEPDIYIGISPALHFQCTYAPLITNSMMLKFVNKS